ncbi:hypothetical protein ACFWIA_01790 [Streptomyces sp. NPDC127068]|uniref:hypothetical protein n=1 Tax=Streptomyces sp. NPDC127068 TaxID=3347127 RepID=UPI00364BC730
MRVAQDTGRHHHPGPEQGTRTGPEQGAGVRSDEPQVVGEVLAPPCGGRGQRGGHDVAQIGERGEQRVDGVPYGVAAVGES